MYHTAYALVYARVIGCIIIDMHKHRNKRRKRIQLAFVYTLMAIAVLSIVAILVLVVQGYRYNRFDGKIEQGGLVQFDSRPAGATVTVDDITLANRTASKVTLSAGRHTITMTRDGYSSWKKDALVRAGGILWLNYSLLFPNNPKISTAATYANVASAIASPDHKFMAVVPKNDAPVIALTALDTETPTTSSLTIPATSFTAPPEGAAQSFVVQSWSKDSRLLLVTHIYGDKTEYISFDTQSSKAHNISVELGLDITKVAYSLGDSNILYALTSARELRRLNLSSQTVSGPLVSNVGDFAVSEERLVTYETLADASGARTVGYVSSGSSKAKTLATDKSLVDKALAVATGNYYGEHYTVILRNNTVTISKGSLPASDSDAAIDLKEVTTLTLNEPGNYVGFSPELNRMVYVASGSRIVTYDLELKASSTVTLQEALTRDVEWLDPYHIVATGQNSYYYDYDGTNGQLFASNTLNQPAVLSPNEKYIYYFAKTESTSVLRRVKLTTD